MQAVIFDMDGVIVDSEPLKFRAYREIFKKIYNVSLPVEDTSWFGRKESLNMKYFLEMFNLLGDIPNLIIKKREQYWKIVKEEGVELIEGIENFIESLKNNQIPIAVATASDIKSMNLIMDKIKFANNFNAIITVDDVKEAKPDPEVYLKCANKLAVDNRRCIAFEDTQIGIEAAKRAGMKCVAIMNNYQKDKLSKADLIISSFEEINLTRLRELII